MSDGGAPTGSGEAGPEGFGQTVGGDPPPVRARELAKSFHQADGSELRVLERVDLSVEQGEAVAVIGASGAGKSTLLHLLGGLDRPSSGEVRVGGRRLDELGDEELAAVRSAKIGFVFQFHHLLREFSALENVMMPMLVGRWDRAEARSRARALLESVGLSQRLDHRPTELSGGEQQRVAVARALANRPVVLLADEPSGNLDEQTSERLHDLLFQLREERSLAMVLVTHNLELARRTDRVLLLEDGRLQERPGGTRGGIEEAERSARVHENAGTDEDDGTDRGGRDG